MYLLLSYKYSSYTVAMPHLQLQVVVGDCGWLGSRPFRGIYMRTTYVRSIMEAYSNRLLRMPPPYYPRETVLGRGTHVGIGILTFGVVTCSCLQTAGV